MDDINIEIKGILASIKELRESQADTDRQLKETSQQLKETDRQLKESITGLTEKQADTDRQLKETDNLLKRSIATNDKLAKELRKEMGGISNSNGEIAEEFFENVFLYDRTFAGMHFHDMIRRKRFDDRKRHDEFDIIMLNEENALIVETKYKAREEDIEEVVKKAEAFRYWYPEYKEHKIYLCLASLRFEDNIIGKARKQGIAIIQQLGEKTVVNEENLKAY